jgi:hypothetical protein
MPWQIDMHAMALDELGHAGRGASCERLPVTSEFAFSPTSPESCQRYCRLTIAVFEPLRCRDSPVAIRSHQPDNDHIEVGSPATRYRRQRGGGSPFLVVQWPARCRPNRTSVRRTKKRPSDLSAWGVRVDPWATQRGRDRNFPEARWYRIGECSTAHVVSVRSLFPVSPRGAVVASVGEVPVAASWRGHWATRSKVAPHRQGDRNVQRQR